MQTSGPDAKRGFEIRVKGLRLQGEGFGVERLVKLRATVEGLVFRDLGCNARYRWFQSFAKCLRLLKHAHPHHEGPFKGVQQVMNPPQSC